MSAMKQWSAIFSLLMLAGCASILGNRTVNVTETEIQQMLNEKLAVPIALLKVFDVNLSNALVSFDQTTGRMHSTMDARLSSALFDENMTGKLGISGKLRFDAATSTIVLDEPTIEQMNLNGASEKDNELLKALATVVGGELLNGLALYKVKPEDLSVAGTQYTPKEMIVTDRGLQIMLSPN
jgi:hypothetical protein